MKNNKIATRTTIADFFKTDDLTTHRILMNLNWGFFATHFKDDANKMWDEAHPFLYPAHPSKDYTSISLDFIALHFDLFSKKQFVTSAGWEFNPQINKMEWTYNNYYIDVIN